VNVGFCYVILVHPDWGSKLLDRPPVRILEIFPCIGTLIVLRVDSSHFGFVKSLSNQTPFGLCPKALFLAEMLFRAFCSRQKYLCSIYILIQNQIENLLLRRKFRQKFVFYNLTPVLLDSRTLQYWTKIDFYIRVGRGSPWLSEPPKSAAMPDSTPERRKPRLGSS